MPTPSTRGGPASLIDFLDPSNAIRPRAMSRDAMNASIIHRRGKRAIVAGGTGFYVRALIGERDAGAAVRRIGARAARPKRAFIRPSSCTSGLRIATRPRRRSSIPRHAIACSSARGRARSARSERRRRAYACGRRNRVAARLSRRSARRTRRADRGAHATACWKTDCSMRPNDRRRCGCGERGRLSAGTRYLRGWSTRANCASSLERATRRYARRQRAWFRGEHDVLWLEPGQSRAWYGKNSAGLRSW